MVRILKIGGSVITDKTVEGTLRKDILERIACEISGTKNLVLVHGAGSFGHIPAQRFGLPEKFDPHGMLLTHLSVMQLNQAVVQALDRAGCHPLPVHPWASVILRDGRIEHMDMDVIFYALERGFMPVTHGDVSLDRRTGGGIVSGDQLVAHIASRVGAEMVALGTDVDGVLDADGGVIPVLSPRDLQSLRIGSSAAADVTGGMKGKLMELSHLVESGLQARVFNAKVKDNVARVLAGEQVGTCIRRDP